MKRILISVLLLSVVLTACNDIKTETNYYLSLSGESEHWKLDGYQIMITPEAFKAGNGVLTTQNKDEHTANFFSFDVYAVAGGEESRFHGHSVSGETDIVEQTLGTINGEDSTLKDFTEIDEIYAVVTWNDDTTDGDQEERITLYNKFEDDSTLLE